MTAARLDSRRRDAQRSAGKHEMRVAVQLCRKWMLRQTRRTPRTSHTATPRARCSRRGCASRSKPPLRWRVPRSLWLNPASLRALFAVYGASFGHNGTSHFGFLTSDCALARCRSSITTSASTPRTHEMIFGRPTVDNKRFSTGTPEATKATTPRGRDHFHARIRARTAYRTTFPCAPRAHASPPPASPLSSRAHLFPSTRP